MRLTRNEESFEGVHAMSAIAMAFMEMTGIRALIDRSCDFDDERKLTPGNAVKAMIGPIFDEKKKLPLSGIRHYYNGAPTDILFGKGVSVESLNDNALARNLDTLFDAGLERLFWDCAGLIKRHFSLESRIRHLDFSNYTVFALPSDDLGDGAATPEFGGNAKDGRNDLLQYNMATITNGNRILEYCRAYSGNVSDNVMDSDVLDFLRDNTDPSEDVIVADCKLVNSMLIEKMMDMGVGFVSKVPEFFSGKIRDVIIESALMGDMDVCGIEGYEVYNTQAETSNGMLRFIAYRSPKETGRAMGYLERQGLIDAERRFKPFSKMRFACRDDAMRCFNEVLSTHRNSAYVVTGTPIAIETVEKRPTRGRPGKGSGPPKVVTEWMVEVSKEFHREIAVELARRHDLSVIVTNIPLRNEDCENIRHGATTDTVLRLYLDQYKAEHTYRLMKSGMGVDQVFVHIPRRANALLFVVAMATLISSVMDALLKRNGCRRYRTVKQACIRIQQASIRFRRSTDDADIIGPEGSVDDVFDLIDGLGIDPNTLFQRFDG